MATRRDVLLERFFTALISGDRASARSIVDEALTADCPAEQITMGLFWPTLQHVQSLRRADQLAALGYAFAMRTLRQQIDQMQMRLERAQSRDERVLLVCGDELGEELAAQIACDLLEADGYEVYFAGGGIAVDEVAARVSEVRADRLVIFGATAAIVPATRALIDRLHEIGANEGLQVIVGGGVFNRAEGLAEEIGADLWALDPAELVEVMAEEPERRMSADQRTVGRNRRKTARRIAA